MKKVLLGLLMVLLGAVCVEAQHLQKFSIASFELDPFDITPLNKLYEKVDGSGFRYAIIKVSSTNPDDNLKEYSFNFGNLNSFVEQHDNELWVYVQKNAKLVTISRPGYTTLNKYDLKTTIQDGKVYVMQLDAAKPVVHTQMVLFNITPANAGTIVTVRSMKANAQEEVFGTTDINGSVAKALQLGTYTYKVIANNYITSEGRFTLDDRHQIYQERVVLKSNKVETPAPIQVAKKKSLTGCYIQASGQAGTMMGYGANLGVYISHFNMDAYLTMTMEKEAVPMYDTNSLVASEASISGMMFGAKLGCGIRAGSSVVITPQLGAGVLNVSGDGVGSSAICATGGLRIEIAFGKHFGLSLTPEGHFAVSKKEVFKQLEDISSKIKGWGTGANLRAGLYVKF